MASDVGKILAAAATGGGPKVVDITLRLRPDPANSGVVKQLCDQVSDTVRKTYQDIETVTQKLVASANQSAKSIGDAMSKALERVSAKHTEINAKMEAEDRVVWEAHKRRVADAERDSKRQAETEAALARQAEQNAIASLDRVHEHRRKKGEEGKREEPRNNGLKQFAEVSAEAGGLIKEVALAIAPKEAAEQLARSLEKFDQIFKIFEHGLKVITGINEALVKMKEFAAAAAVEQRLLAAAQAAGAAGTGGGARSTGGLASAAAIFGEGALASAGNAAAVAGVSALVVGAGIAVHDTLAKLTGKFESLTGVVDDWIATTKRNVELEKSIERQQRAHKWETERFKEQAVQTQKYLEGRARIEEGEDRQGAIRRYASRTADFAYLPLADSIGVGTKGEPELRARAEESARRNAQQREDEEVARALGRYLRGHRELNETVLENKKRAYGIGPLNLGSFQGRPTPEQLEAHQKEIDEAEAAVVHEGWGHAFKQWWLGAGSTTMSLERAKTEQELAKGMNLSPMGGTPEAIENLKRRLREAGSSPYGNSPKEIDRYIQEKLEEGGIDPHSSVMGISGAYKPDVAKQQLLEAEQIQLAQHLYELTQKRQDVLLSELATMRQQIQASKEKVAAAKEGVRVAQEQVNARKAEIAFSMSRADQKNAAGILTELEQGKSLSLDKLLFLKQHGLTGGKAGAKIDELGAKYLDPTFAAIGKKLGMFGEDELGKKEKELADATRILKGEFEQFGKTLKGALGNLVVLGFAGMVGGHATRVHERTDAHAGGHPDPNERPGKSKAAIALEQSADRIVAAIDEWEKLDIESFKRIEQRLGGAVQRVKEAHKTN